MKHRDRKDSSPNINLSEVSNSSSSSIDLVGWSWAARSGPCVHITSCFPMNTLRVFGLKTRASLRFGISEMRFNDHSSWLRNRRHWTCNGCLTLPHLRRDGRDQFPPLPRCRNPRDVCGRTTSEAGKAVTERRRPRKPGDRDRRGRIRRSNTKLPPLSAVLTRWQTSFEPTKATPSTALDGTVDEPVTVMPDGLPAYRSVGKTPPHLAINHSAGNMSH